MNNFLLGWQLLRRDWHAGEWRILLLALLLAVASLASVGLFAERIRLALQQEASSLIGADLRISSTRVLPTAYRTAAEQRQLSSINTLSFMSMVGNASQNILSEILAVEPGYPLRGKLELQQTQHGVPAPGTIWVDEKLLRSLPAKVGEQLQVGLIQLTIGNVVTRELDRAAALYSFAPRLLMNEQDVAATGLIQPGSRVMYRLLIAGDAQQIQALQAGLTMAHGEKMETVRDARPEIRTVLERAEHFLGLAALTTAILAGVALFLAARRFVERHLDSCAVMRCLGAQQGQVLQIFMAQLGIVSLCGIVLGCALGYLTQQLLVQFIQQFANANLPAPSLLPAVKAALSGWTLVLGFAFLPLLQLRKVPPLRVLRRELGAPAANLWLVYAGALLALSALFLWQANSLKLGLSVLAGLLLGLLLFGASAWGILRLLGRFNYTITTQLARHSKPAALQIMALSLGGMALLLLTVVRADLLASWQDKLPADTPNRFLVNVQPDQHQAVLDFFQQQQLPPPQLLPMIRGRLIAINQQPIRSEQFGEQRNLVEREFNLSYASTLPAWNELAEGKWWQAHETGQFSVEQGLAQRLNLHIGDTLSYDIAGSIVHGRISNLRKLQWDSMRVNFFVIATPDLLQDQPTGYLSSFYLPENKANTGHQLSQKFPNVLLIDTDNLIKQIRHILDQITQVMRVIFIFTLACGMVVLYAALLASHDERRQTTAILRTLGASSRYIHSLHLAEFAVLGGLSGLLAATGATSLGWALAEFVLHIPYHTTLSIWPVSCGAGMLLVSIAGMLHTRRLMDLPPLVILRE